MIPKHVRGMSMQCPSTTRFVVPTWVGGWSSSRGSPPRCFINFWAKAKVRLPLIRIPFVKSWGRRRPIDNYVNIGQHGSPKISLRNWHNLGQSTPCDSPLEITCTSPMVFIVSKNRGHDNLQIIVMLDTSLPWRGAVSSLDLLSGKLHEFCFHFSLPPPTVLYSFHSRRMF